MGRGEGYEMSEPLKYRLKDGVLRCDEYNQEIWFQEVKYDSRFLFVLITDYEKLRKENDSLRSEINRLRSIEVNNKKPL
jgi:cell division protein FtsB